MTTERGNQYLVLTGEMMASGIEYSFVPFHDVKSS